MGLILDATPHTLKHFGPTTRSEATGAAIIPTPTSSTIEVGVQPLQGKDRQALEEGYRHLDGRKLYTESVLTPVDQYLGITGDIVVIDGFDYLVVKVWPSSNVLPHYKAACVRVQEADPDA